MERSDSITLDLLKLNNFMGIENFVIEPEGKDFTIRSQNGTGKTTIFSAFCWLLFHEDSKGQSQQHFDIKTLEESGEPRHHLDHTVTGVIKKGSEVYEFRKTFYEEWVKPRGKADKEFDGHTVDYEVDGVGKKKSEYDEKVGELLKPSQLRLLVDPRYYNEQLHWEIRREILLEVLGDVSHKDVVAENSDLNDLEMGKLEPKEYRKKLKRKQKQINSDLSDLETRIKEANRSDEPDFDRSLPELTDELSDLSDKAEAIREEIAELKAQGPKAEIKSKIQDVKSDMKDFASKHREELQEEIDKVQDKLNERLNTINELSSRYQTLESKVKQKEKRIKELKDKRERLRKDYWELDNSEDVCPLCGREIPEDKFGEFNDSKAEEKKEIRAGGINAKEEQDTLETEVSDLIAEMKKINDDLYTAVVESEELQATKDDLEDGMDSYVEDDEYKELKAEKERLEKRLKEADEETPEEITEKRQELAEGENQIKELQKKIETARSVEKVRDRVEELKKREEKLSDKYEELEQQRVKVDLYTKTKVDMLESKINNHFDLVNFKLFDRLVKGGVEPTCETQVDGVSYNNTLNTGAKIQAGLDIIKTLSEHYGVKAPLWIDNAESIMDIPQLETQTAELHVSGHDELMIDVD